MACLKEINYRLIINIVKTMNNKIYSYPSSSSSLIDLGRVRDAIGLILKLTLNKGRFFFVRFFAYNLQHNSLHKTYL